MGGLPPYELETKGWRHETCNFVPYIIWSMVESVVFMAAPIKRWIIQKHAMDIRLNGEDIKVIVTTKRNLVSEESCKDQVKCWHGSVQPNVQPHDEPMPEVQYSNYFTPCRFYCVETICAPCGVVIAWAKFAKAESPTNILQFLASVYPTEDS